LLGLLLRLGFGGRGGASARLSSGLASGRSADIGPARSGDRYSLPLLLGSSRRIDLVRERPVIPTQTTSSALYRFPTLFPDPLQQLLDSPFKSKRHLVNHVNQHTNRQPSRFRIKQGRPDETQGRSIVHRITHDVEGERGDSM